jgi:hypothetical protein
MCRRVRFRILAPLTTTMGGCRTIIRAAGTRTFLEGADVTLTRYRGAVTTTIVIRFIHTGPTVELEGGDGV